LWTFGGDVPSARHPERGRRAAARPGDGVEADIVRHLARWMIEQMPGSFIRIREGNLVEFQLDASLRANDLVSRSG